MCLEPTCASRRCAAQADRGLNCWSIWHLVTDGRPFPSDEQANDVVHRQTVLLTRGADAAARQLHSDRVNFVSSGVIANQTGQLGFSKALLVRDPDGHAIEIEEK